MSLFWSLKAKTVSSLGRAYWSTRSGSIFVGNIFYWTKDFGEFIYELTRVMFHEYLHLFFKFEIGENYNSCKTVLDPLAHQLAKEMAKDLVFVERIVDDFMECVREADKLELNL